MLLCALINHGYNFEPVDNRFQNCCYEFTIHLLATSMCVLHAFLQNVNFSLCVRNGTIMAIKFEKNGGLNQKDLLRKH